MFIVVANSIAFAVAWFKPDIFELAISWAFSGFAALAITFVLCAAFLFLIGSARSFFTGKGGVRSGVEMLAVGTAVAALTYVVGVLFRA